MKHLHQKVFPPRLILESVNIQWTYNYHKSELMGSVLNIEFFSINNLYAKFNSNNMCGVGGTRSNVMNYYKELKMYVR